MRVHLPSLALSRQGRYLQSSVQFTMVSLSYGIMGSGNEKRVDANPGLSRL